MTITSSGAVSLSAVQTEFGGTNPISMSEYYAGGLRVPSGTVGVNGAVPASGANSISKFYGTAAVALSKLYAWGTSSGVTSGFYSVPAQVGSAIWTELGCAGSTILGISA